MNLADLLSKQAETRPSEPALVLPCGVLSYLELDSLVWRAAAQLHESGIAPGDRVALSFSDELGVVVGMLASARLGATAFSMQLNWPPILRIETVERVGIQYVVGDHGAIQGSNAQQINMVMDELLARPPIPPTSAIHVSEPRAPWLILLGSGTTGQPKMMPITHAQQLARCESAREWFGLTAADRVGSLIHFDYSSTKTRFLEALVVGASFFIPDRKRKDMPAQCRNAGVSVLHGTSFLLEQLMAAPRHPQYPLLDFLRVLTVGSSTITDEFRKRVAAQLCSNLHIHYGTNETGLLTYSQPPLAFNISGTVGQALAEAKIEIVDTQGHCLAPGLVGQIRARRPGMIDGYLESDEATRVAFKDGWFYPGDLGKFTQDGQLIYCGRADHMMIMNGINIYPAEIERTILQHPAVRDAAAVPLRSALHQDLPVCAVTLQAEIQIGEQALLGYAYQHLGPRSPRKLFILDRIPRNEQGKLIRPQLMQAIHDKLRKQHAPRIADHISPVPRQSMRKMEIRYDDNASADLAVIDDWLTSVLHIKIEPCRSLAGPPENSAVVRRVALTWRILLLLRELMQAARIPLFDPGRIIAISPDRTSPSAWTAAVAVASIEHLSPIAHATASEGARTMIRWMAEHSRSAENTALLLAMAQKQVLQPLQRLFPAGKSTIHLLRAAYAQDIPFMHLGSGIFQLGWGCRARKIDRSTTDADSAIGSKLAQNKVWSANLIRLAGLPAPRQIVVSTEAEARLAAKRLGGSLVVKPIDRDRGEGVTVGIRNDTQLLAALKAASGLSKNRRIIIEAEASGVCHRLFIAKGQLLYAVKRLPKSIHGDGRQTVMELIRAANQREKSLPPWLRSEPYPDDAQAVEAMAAAGFAPDSVPAAGERVPLRRIESTAAGGFDEDVTRRIHPDNLDIAIRAAALFDLEVAGIDIITPDIGRPWHENGAIINEVNFAPLLGGGEISRSHVPEFLGRIIAGNGRIPIEAFLGDETAVVAARRRQGVLIAQGAACYLVRHGQTVAPAGVEIRLPFASLARRCAALLMDQRVGAIIVVARTAEQLRADMPVDRFDRITPCSPSSAPPVTSVPAVPERQHHPAQKNAAFWRNEGANRKAAKDYPAAIDAFRRSLTLEDDLPTRNALVLTLEAAGQTEAALIEGLRNLEAKDVIALQAIQTFAGQPLALNSIRHRFDPRTPQRNIIAFSLWGDNPTYVHGAIVNARLAQNLYYGWKTRFYCARDVPADALETLKKLGAQVVMVDDPRLAGVRPFWRFLVADDPEVHFFACRDTDSRLNAQELNAVDAWLRSGKPFHAMRDHIYHMELLLAGLWGGMAGVLPPLLPRILSRPEYAGNRFADQLFLMEFVWPLVRDHILVHDSHYRFHGSVDFPGAYRLPRPVHVGGAIKTMETWRT